MSLIKFMHSLGKGEVESNLLKTMLLSLAVSFITFVVIYFLQLKTIEDFIPTYGFFFFFSFLTYALILPSTKHVKAYKEFPCMSGMMIGMTIGMISGFLPGFYVGSTNGMFYGSVFGMAVGILFGIWNGKCCGIMGAMEGIMAGFMGGIMGAMTSLMMFNDHLKAMGIIVFLISSVIVFKLNYLIYKESHQLEKNSIEGNFTTILWSFLLAVFTIWFIVYGPRGGLLLQ
ncbi:MAG: hypothetical protein AABX16_02795 [Nanoarchaeota archaeon]